MAKKLNKLERAKREARLAAYREIAEMLPDDKTRFIAEAWIEGFLAGMAAYPVASQFPVRQVQSVLETLARVTRDVNGELAPF